VKPLVAPRGIEIIRGGGVTSPMGFVAGGAAAGIKTLGTAPLDVGILASETPCVAAAMFTRSTVKGAAVLTSQRNVGDGRVQAIVVNSGCSNVATGPQGIRDAEEMCELAAAKAGVVASDVICGSTGVIGRLLPMAKIRNGAKKLVLTADGGADFARAIVTTDTYTKEVAVSFKANRRTYTIGACAKGSGMIHPDMATMFCWITTDAPVRRALLRAMLRSAVDASINMVSVDNDTSTSDTTAILANAAAGGPPIVAGTPAAAAFERALRYVCVTIARLLARDGEGAEKIIEVRIEGAATLRDARAAARTVSASPLVKTAVHGNDPNWGRVLMAIGRSGARIDLTKARVWLGETQVYRSVPLPYDESAISGYLRNEEVVLRAHLGAGRASATAWGCDLTDAYVHINSDYTT
jgi:glutamate N-acetyltransferase/amino-acid N-acetyltransferase